MRRFFLIILTLLIFSVGHHSYGQFMDGFGGGSSSSSGNSTSSGSTDTTQSYTLGRYFKSLGHKDTMAIGWSFGGSLILPGTSQIYNKDYWKLPVIYVGIGGMLGGGLYYNSQFKKTGSEEDKLYRNLFFIGAAAFYWAQLMDGAVNYPTKRDHLPGRATVYSILFPGLGQIYNREFWKLPIYYGGLAAAGYFWYYNGIQYKRFQADYMAATTPGMSYNGPLSAENLKYYKDYYRRFRDYSIVATVVLYLLQIIDADVFATMYDFNIVDGISMDIEPAIIEPLNYSRDIQFATTVPANNAVGIKLNLTF